MSIFKVGDRVRIKYSNSWPELDGTEGTVVGPTATSRVTKTKYVTGIYVSPDLWGSIHAPRTGLLGGELFAPAPDQLEPIQPPKSQIDEILAMRDLPDFEIARIAA